MEVNGRLRMASKEATRAGGRGRRTVTEGAGETDGDGGSGEGGECGGGGRRRRGWRRRCRRGRRTVTEEAYKVATAGDMEGDRGGEEGGEAGEGDGVGGGGDADGAGGDGGGEGEGWATEAVREMDGEGGGDRGERATEERDGGECLKEEQNQPRQEGAQEAYGDGQMAQLQHQAPAATGTDCDAAAAVLANREAAHGRGGHLAAHLGGYRGCSRRATVPASGSIRVLHGRGPRIAVVDAVVPHHRVQGGGDVAVRLNPDDVPPLPSWLRPAAVATLLRREEEEGKRKVEREEEQYPRIQHAATSGQQLHFTSGLQLLLQILY
uniref:Uncharacterized protein n=1 Tax=Oryza glumipatula TaxID=40148 RepID=A0A0E0A8N2_9ORYZ